MTAQGFTKLKGFRLSPPHPLAGRDAWRCWICGAIFYPAGEPSDCPYCDEDDDE